MGLLASLCASLPYATLAAAEARGEAAALSPLPAEAGGPPPGLRRGVSVFSLVVPRLWPFMHRHPAADVRAAAMATLERLAAAAARSAAKAGGGGGGGGGSGGAAAGWLAPLLPTALRLLLQARSLVTALEKERARGERGERGGFASRRCCSMRPQRRTRRRGARGEHCWLPLRPR